MPKPEDIEGLKDIKIGELNDISFDMEDPLLTNELDGESLLTNLLSAFVKRESAFDRKRPHKGIVLLSTKVQTTGVVGVHGIGLKALEFLGVNNIRNFAVVRVPEIHGGIPIPNMQALVEVQANSYERSSKTPAKFAEISEQDKLLLSMHDPYFSAPIGSDGMEPLKPGDIVLLDGDGIIIKKVEDSEVGFFGRALQSIRSLFGGGAGKPLGGQVLEDLNDSAINADLDFTPTIVGDDLTAVSGIVSQETAFWSDKVETDPEAYPRLQLYWDTVGIAVGGWDPQGTPWSAAYISYVLNAAGSGLSPVAAHYEYVQQATDGVGGYGIIDLAGESAQIEPNIGDIFVKRRGGGVTATHGDIVYEISDGQVLLSGGNVGSDRDGQQTVKSGDSQATGRILTLDGDGYYNNFGPYVTLVKLNPKFV
tara:strand:- start:1280 stop:2545 length:1266 start_codon:yes stop_codon:yes gene_type:complete